MALDWEVVEAGPDVIENRRFIVTTAVAAILRALWRPSRALLCPDVPLVSPLLIPPLDD